jgi:sarcosine oxidase subunit delta
MFLIDCPNCGVRSAAEFRYGGEHRLRPQSADQREWADYVYIRENRPGLQTEWWYHRMGCRRWFLVRRDTLTNQMSGTFRVQEAKTTAST